MSFVNNLNRVTVYYSSYGCEYTKPTDLFSNRDIAKYFDLKISRGFIHLDYVKQYNDFKGRCKIPSKLIDDICKALIDLGNKERRF